MKALSYVILLPLVAICFVIGFFVGTYEYIRTYAPYGYKLGWSVFLNGGMYMHYIYCGNSWAEFISPAFDKLASRLGL